MSTSTIDMNALAQQQGEEEQQSPYAGQGQERTHDAPKVSGLDASTEDDEELSLLEEDKQKLIEIGNQYVDRWSPVRRKKIRNVLKAREYLKGNQYIAFDKDNFVWFDPQEAMFDGDPDMEDLGVYRYTNNIYQMLALSFVAALCSGTPKTRFRPRDAEKVEDTATAKAGTTLQEIVERQNGIKDVMKQELMFLWTDGCYFSYQRFIVDGDRAGTHREPVLSVQNRMVEPDRFVCRQCGSTTMASDLNPAMMRPVCLGNEELGEPGCGYELSPSDYYPEEYAEVPVITKYKDVPNGMVAITIYGALNVIAAPHVNELYRSPILRLDEEVDKASIRASYPDAWDQIGKDEKGSSESENERQARQTVFNMIGGRNNMTSEMLPTLSRTWIQPWAFNSTDDRAQAAKFQKMFPKGCLVVHCGPIFLEAREESFTEHWTWCGTVKGYGLYPFGVGDVAIDVQDRINDASNTVAEHMDRNACPPLVVDTAAFDPKAMNQKPLLAGVMHGISRKTAPTRPISDFIFQPSIQVDGHIYSYIDNLVLFAQLVSGVMPQIFGGTQQGVDTAAGQRQALNTAIGRLSLFYENIRTEHADKAAQCVRIAGTCYTEDIQDTLVGGSDDYRNRYVRIADLGGEFHAEPETEQGIPQTYAEIQQRLQDMFLQAGENPLFMELLEEPQNQKEFASYLLPDNIVIPGEADRTKCTRIINKLLESAPVTVPTPAGPMILPTVQVDEDYDNPEIIQKVIKRWATENYEMQFENQQGWANVLAYYRQAAQIQAMRDAKQAVQEQLAAAQTAGPGPAEASAPQQ